MSSNFASKILGLPPKRLALLALELHEELQKTRTGWPIAIVGAGCRLPGNITSPESFWKALIEGRDCITAVPGERWSVEDFYDPAPGTPGRMYTKEGGFVSNVDWFDARFFGISAREAIRMDPQQRLLLEVAWEAFEHAGLAPASLRGTAAGVFVGITTCDYATLLQESNTLTNADLFGISGTSLNAAPGRISYALGLNGPSVAIDTACSSSLVAIHQACSSLAAHECETALAGGVNLILTAYVHVLASQAQMLARDGRCKTFDESADGFGRAEGCVLLVLKRLSDAISAGDCIMAVIPGSAVNHGGASGGFSVPNPKAQTAVIQRALAAASIDPRAIGFIETHGTGTSLGDPIEVRALADALAAREADRREIWLGAVKSNIGHAESAAGAVSLLKAALVVQHGVVPRNLHCSNPNHAVDWDRLPFRLPQNESQWPVKYEHRVAGVSSFGMSGTNTHILVMEAPPSPFSSVTGSASSILTISARSHAELLQLSERYREFLVRSVPWRDVCFTAAAGRNHFDHRLAIIAPDAITAASLIDNWIACGGQESRVRSGACAGSELEKIAASYCAGADIDWIDHWRGSHANRIPLPTYCFNRERYWVNAEREKLEPVVPSLFAPVWNPVDFAPRSCLIGRWLLLSDDDAPDLASVLRQAGNELNIQSIRPALSTIIPDGQYAGIIVYLPLSSCIQRDQSNEPSGSPIPVKQLLNLARWVAASQDSSPIWFVTRSAQPVCSTTPNDSSAIWGFVRTLAIENSRRLLGLCDLPPGALDNAGLLALIATLGQSTETQVAVRAGKTYSIRIKESLERAATFAARSDGTYLITGGLGGVGEICAQVLLDAGAGHVVLTGIKELDEDRREKLEQIASGRSVTFLRSDVSSLKETEELFVHLRQHCLPLRGIIHSALFLVDRPAAMLSEAEVNSVLRPKVAGTLNLHRCSLDHQLDFFLLLSSVSGVLGNGGQSAYAAGNAFQDSLAYARRDFGFPAMTINLGPVEDTGAIRRIASVRKLPPLVRALGVQQTRNAIQSLLNATGTQYVLCALDREGLNALPDQSVPPVLSELRVLRTPTQARTRLSELLAKSTNGSRPQVLRNWLRELASAVLEQPGSTLEPNRPLQEYGLDSLLALELRNRIVLESGHDAPPSLLFDYPTIDALGRFIENLMSEPAKITEQKSCKADSAELTQEEAALLLEQMADEVLFSGRML